MEIFAFFASSAFDGGSDAFVLLADAAARVNAQRFGLLVVGFVVAFAVWQFRDQLDRVRRPHARFGGVAEREFSFLKRQAFRRLQLSGLAGLAGALMFVGLYLPADRFPRFWSLVWLAVIFFVGWAALIACVDGVSIWLHYSSDGRRQSAEKILIDYKMRRLREQSNAAAALNDEKDAEKTNSAADESEPSAENADKR